MNMDTEINEFTDRIFAMGIELAAARVLHAANSQGDQRTKDLLVSLANSLMDEAELRSKAA